jgi:fatty acid desaturase
MNEHESHEEIPERATPALAVVRIVTVLGMSFGVSFGIFMAIGGWWVPAVISILAAVPFFFLMRYMEKKTGTEE